MTSSPDRQPESAFNPFNPFPLSLMEFGFLRAQTDAVAHLQTATPSLHGCTAWQILALRGFSLFLNAVARMAYRHLGVLGVLQEKNAGSELHGLNSAITRQHVHDTCSTIHDAGRRIKTFRNLHQNFINILRLLAESQGTTVISWHGCSQSQMFLNDLAVPSAASSVSLP